MKKYNKLITETPYVNKLSNENKEFIKDFNKDLANDKAGYSRRFDLMNAPIVIHSTEKGKSENVQSLTNESLFENISSPNVNIIMLPIKTQKSKALSARPKAMTPQYSRNTIEDFLITLIDLKREEEQKQKIRDEKELYRRKRLKYSEQNTRTFFKKNP